MLSGFNPRKLIILLFIGAIFSNFFQWASGYRVSNPWKSSDMVEYFEYQSNKKFDGFIFQNQCIKQHEGSFSDFGTGEKNKLKSEGKVYLGEFNDKEKYVIFGGVHPVFWGEITVLVLSFLLVSIVICSKIKYKVFKKDYVIGFYIGFSVLFIDQIRYIYTSIDRSILPFWYSDWVSNPKSLFTWSSYCFTGDWAWFYDFLGYVFMYAAVAIGISVFSSIVREINSIEHNTDHLNIHKNENLRTVCRVYTWLPFFSYMGFAVWVACTQVNGAANAAYAVQAVILTVILMLVFTACYWCIYRSYNIFEKKRNLIMEKGETPPDNPMKEFHDPFGSKAVVIVFKIILPPLTMLALWSEVIASLLKFA